MKSTKNKILVLLFLLGGFTKQLTAKPTSTFSCNDLVHFSLGNSCEGLITINEILEDDDLDENDFTITINQANGNAVANPVTGAFIGETLTVTVTQNSDNNSCWGMALIEDKFPPSLTCSDVAIECFESGDLAPLPILTDNCDPNPTLYLVDEVINNDDICNGVTIVRTYLGEDENGNTSNSCQHIITVNTALPPTFPGPVFLDCAAILTDSFLLNPINTGLPNVAEGLYCSYTLAYSDDILPECGNSYKILRSFSIMNWCTGQVVIQGANGNSYVQVIEVSDSTPPMIELGAYEVSVNMSADHPNACNSQAYLQPAIISDNCNTWTVSIFTEVGEAIYNNDIDGSNGGFIPSPGLELGNHIITYIATDECGNTSELEVTITVVDNTAPTPVCDEITSVSLIFGMEVIVNAAVFDDGSHDNCCLENFEIRRMNNPCGVAGSLQFNPTITFCCEDVENPDLQVILKVNDCHGNSNTCIVQVDLEDKLSPTVLVCPADTVILCDDLMDGLMAALLVEDYAIFDPIFGTPTFEDNCTLIVFEPSFTDNIDQCSVGTISRLWTATDASNSPPAVCVQNISVAHVSDWVVEFPEDQFVECGEELPETGQPEIFFETCELIAISYEDVYFDIVQNACFKIVRSWTVINWCNVNPNFPDLLVEDIEAGLNADLNGDNTQNERTFQDGLNIGNYNPTAFINGAQPDGVIKYEQIIKGNDTVAPVVTCLDNLSFCVIEDDCDTTVELPLPAVSDCSFELDIIATTVFGDGNIIDNVPLGTFEVTYSVSDKCGNTSVCQTDFTVNDCKFPTPNCVSALIIELDENGQLTINAQVFNSGSFDNCLGELDFSYSTDVTDSLETFNCFSLGLGQLIEIYLTDAAGNQTFCETVIFVQDNMGSCMGNPLIAGTIETAEGEPVSGVSILINAGNSATFETADDGQFIFEDLESNNDFTVTPDKDYFDLNGVTTFDLVIINKHILGSQPMTDPYQMIAADANKSNSISTLDLVQIRKLILLIDDNFVNNTSWRFFDKSHVFNTPNNPFSNLPMEVLGFNNLNEEITNVDFVGVKIGDVNNNVNPLQLTGVDDREFKGKLVIHSDNQSFKKDELVEVSFQINNNDLLGYQFTLDFDTKKLALIEIKDGLASSENFGFSKQKEGAITTSWNGDILTQKSTLFTAYFKAKTKGELQNVLSINSKYTAAEAYDTNLELLGIDLEFDPKNRVVLSPNAPNPFSQQTIFKYELPTAAQVHFLIQDIAGKVIFEAFENGVAGTNEIKVSAEDLADSGMYFYQMETLGEVLVGKLILVE
jgi:hypothetical protein